MVDTLMNLQYDKTGHITSMTLVKPEDTIDHTDDIQNFLEHHGVLGMHWGKHLPGKGLNVSSDQHKRDTQIYGVRGAHRINKNVGKGDSISVARGTEKRKRDRILDTNKYVRVGGKIGGGVLGAGVGFLATHGLGKAAVSPIGKQFLEKHLGDLGTQTVQMIFNSPAVKVAVATGAAKVGTMLSGDIAVRARNRIHGLPANARR